MDSLEESMQTMALEPEHWIKPWWGEHAAKLAASELSMLTMTFCVKPLQSTDEGFVGRLRAHPLVSMPEEPKAPKSKRGRKRKQRKPFPNLICTLKVAAPDKSVTLKMFKNSSIQVCGCRSWTSMLLVCRLIERLYQDGNFIKTADVNNVSLYYDITKAYPSYIPPGMRISLSQLSEFMNKAQPDELGEWEEAGFHDQTRQTNLNLWWQDMTGRRHYASVYPRGSIRITTTDIQMAVHMHSIILERCAMLHATKRLTCLDTTTPIARVEFAQTPSTEAQLYLACN
jgi:hypothetical protein